MSSAWVWLTFAIGGVITFLQRGSFILFVGDRELPEPVRRALRYVAPAAFAAIVAPRVLGGEGLAGLASPGPQLLAAVVAGLFMWRFKNMAAMLVVGMATFWLLRWLM